MSVTQAIFSVGRFLSQILKRRFRFDFADQDAVHSPTSTPLSLPAKILHGLYRRLLLAIKT